MQRPRLEQRLFSLPALGDVFHGQKYDVRADVFPENLPGVEQYDFAADIEENVVDLIAVEHRCIGEDVLEKHPQLGDIPLPVAEVVDEIADGFLGRHLEGLVEAGIGRDNPQLGI